MIWRRDGVEDVAQRIYQNDIVAFSTYVWNHQYNYTVAKRVRELNPDCLIIFGGPEPAITNKDIFRETIQQVNFYKIVQVIEFNAAE
jgi:putative methyltransferase